MKTKLMSLLFLAWSGIAMGQTLSIPDVEALPGETVSYSLNINVGEGAYTGYQYQMQFPATGFTLTGNTSTNSGWQGGSLSVGELDALGKANASAYSSALKAIPTGDIEIGTVEFTVDEGVTTGEYDVTISNFNFLDGTNYTPVADVTFKVKVLDKANDRFTLDENSTTAPIARSGVNVKVIRKLTANKWSTICLPFAMSKAKVEAAFGNDVIIKEYKSYTADINEETLVANSLTLNFATYTMSALKPLKAGTPYLIKTSKDIESFDVDGVNIVSATSDVIGKETVYDLDGTFKGTLVKTKVPDKALFISNNKFYYSNGKTNMKAFRGWFELQAVLNEAVVVESHVYLSLDDETTDINMVHGSGIKADGYYDLQGRKIENPKKGLYINNGKKVVVK